MMNHDNKQFTKTMREELLSLIKQFNTQIENTDYVYDPDRETLRRLRNKIIEAVDEINHLEYKELI